MYQRVEIDYEVPAELAEQRLDQVLAELMPEYSRSRLQQWIKQGGVTVNKVHARPKDKVRALDRIAVRAELEVLETWQPESINLDIVYEDDDILVLNKAAGLVVHPAAGKYTGTLVNALLHHCPTLETVPRAGIVHRLDKETTGLMVVAKNLIAHAHLVQQLQARTVGREYEAVVFGTLTGGGKVVAPISRHPVQRKKMAVVASGKPAITHYRVVKNYRGLAHLRLQLETGRTHQIRVHMTHIHHPLVGDPVYGGRLKMPAGASEALKQMLRSFGRQALHARRLTLIHPATAQEMSWEAPLPQDMLELLDLLEKNEHGESE